MYQCDSYCKAQKLGGGLETSLTCTPILGSLHFLERINTLTTNDDYSRHRNSAACYQLAQSVLKIGSVLAERVGQGEVGGYTALADSAWRLLQLAIEKA